MENSTRATVGAIGRIDEMIRACTERKVHLAAIHQRRFLDSTRVFKQAVDAGRLGRITLADAYVKWFRTQQYYDQGSWRGTWRLDGGGALMNQAIHAIDLLQWFAGMPSEVFCWKTRRVYEHIEAEDTAAEAYERGETTDIASVMLTQQQASIQFEATLQVRNKLLTAYKDIMNMSI